MGRACFRGVAGRGRGRVAVLLVALGVSWETPAWAEPRSVLRQHVAERAAAVESRLIAWRRDLHAHPELSNQETRTAGRVADHLRGLGIQVRTGVARTGVVGVLAGGKKGAVVALRADMDALPVRETTDLPFASKARGTSRGQQVDLMHACGHDGHTAMLMAVAEVLAGMRAELPGTVVFYFQPAEEGPSDVLPDGKNTWGARMMIEEGVLKSPRPAAIFGLHLWAGLPARRIALRAGPVMASSDDLNIRIVGKPTHAGRPWDGIDPIVIGAQVITGLQTIVSRQTNITSTPTIVSVGTIHGGTRYNIIADKVEMAGTIRAYDAGIRKATHERIERTVQHIAASGGAQAQVEIIEKYDPTVNDPALTEWARAPLRWAAGTDLVEAQLSGGAEDFSFFAKQVPGVFLFLGATTPGPEVAAAAPNHSPSFVVDESTLIVGVRALASLATDFLSSNGPTR